MKKQIPDPQKIYTIGKGEKISEAEALSKFTDEMIRLSDSQRSEALDVLKCHLMVEHYLTKYLIKEGILKDNAKTEKMMFGTKMELFKPKDPRILSYRPAMVEMNKVRIGYVHNLGYRVKKKNMQEIMNCVKSLKPTGAPKTLISWIETFTMRVCALLHWNIVEIREG